MSCFYSNSGSGEQKPQKREPREVISRKLIMRELTTISLAVVHTSFFLIKQRKCHLLSLLQSFP